MAVLYGIQYSVSKTRRFSSLAERLIDNQPILIMAREEILSEHLTSARMTEEDLKSKLRGAGITHPNQVFAVILETTGDVSVLKLGTEVDLALFDGVRGAEKLNQGTSAV